MSPCPICQKPVDPLRSRAARVRDGKVIAYCSQECASVSDTKPTQKVEMPAAAAKPADAKAAAKQTPAKGVPASKRTPATGIPTGTGSLESGPVIEIVHEPASGVVTSAADTRTGSTKASVRSGRAETDGAIQIAETGMTDDYIGFDDEPRRGRGLLIFLVLLLLVAGAGAAAYYMGFLDDMLGRKSKAVVVTPPPTPTIVEVAPPDAAVDSPSVTVDHAREALRTQLRSNAPRVQRVAAAALSRTGDPEAISVLAAALTKETSDVPRIELAYALARAGDKRGSDGLVGFLGAARRDVRAEAARRLALLGDPRAVPVLVEYLDVSQLRLGAAEQLAYLAEPRAIAELDKVLKDPKSSQDDQARAAIALGLAGRKDVAPALHKLLEDARFNAFAAGALAVLHDRSAHPLLVKQLEIPSLRVNAARSLRKLDADLDASALLRPLVAALATEKDTGQVQVAEAILLLAGPIAWSAHE
ncbi:MAG: lyase domain protein repeat-containing protein [Myxococcales bacterium]|nr:lyase domain protein repeat-containing protein [Myxococcales bacterium]